MRHRKWRWWTSKLTDFSDQNPVSSNIVRPLLLIDRADERVDSFQKRPTKTPFHFCVTSFARLAFSFSSRAARVPGDRRRETKRRGDTCCSQTCPHNRSTARACAFHAPRACVDAEHRVYYLRRYVDSCHCVVKNKPCVVFMARARHTSRCHASRASNACTSSRSIPSPNHPSSTSTSPSSPPTTTRSLPCTTSDLTPPSPLRLNRRTLRLRTSRPPARPTCATSPKRARPTCATSPKRPARNRRFPAATPRALKYDPLLQQPSLSTVSRTSRPRSPRNFLFSVGGGPYGFQTIRHRRVFPTLRKVRQTKCASHASVWPSFHSSNDTLRRAPRGGSKRPG